MSGRPFLTSLTGRFWILVCVALPLLGCRPPFPSSQPNFPVKLLLQTIDSASKSLRDFKGSASVETSFDGRKIRTSLRLRYLNPGQYRVDVEGAMFQTLAVLLIHDHYLRLYIPRENTVFTGTLETHDATIPGLDISLEDVHEIVTGMVEPGRYQRLPVVDYRYHDHSATITLQDERGRKILWIDTKKMTLIREESESHKDNSSVVKTFHRYQERNGIWRPSSIRIIRSSGKAGTIELKYRTQSVNRGLQPSDIDVHLPTTVLRRPLTEAASIYKMMDETLVP